jgi:hypothetical protein
MPTARTGLALLAVLAVAACGHRGGAPPAGSSAPAPSAAPAASSAAAPAASGSAGPTIPAKSVTADADASSAPPVAEFSGARTDKACKAQTAEIATYQQQGEMALGGLPSGVGASWLVHLAGKREQQIAFSSFDGEAKPLARPRGVGLQGDGGPRVFGGGSGFTVAWFDSRGLAYVRPAIAPLPAPDINHVSAVGPDVREDVALSSTPSGAVVAAALLGDKQVSLFLFAPAEEGAPPMQALGVTHHAKEPRHPAVAAGAAGIFVAWTEPDGRIAASRFDAKGKETEAPCTVAPASAEPRDRLTLAAAGEGAIALWMEGSAIRARALDAQGCPTSPAWKIGEGRWATLTALGPGAVAAWVAADGRLLGARLGPNAAPPPKGLDAAEGSAGVKDPPAIAAIGGKVAFGWAEPMSAFVSTKRLQLRIVDGACLP